MFLHFLGAPSLDASFDGPYGVYHSFTGAEVARYARDLEKAGAAALEVAPVIEAARKLEAAGTLFKCEARRLIGRGRATARPG